MAGCWSPQTARAGLWGQGWLSLMYGKSSTRAVLLLLGIQLTGKSWWASLSISSLIACPIKLANCLGSCKSFFSRLFLSLSCLAVAVRYSFDFTENKVDGLFWEPLLNKQV